MGNWTSRPLKGGFFVYNGLIMSGDIRDRDYQTQDTRLLPALLFVTGVLGAPSLGLAYYFDQTGPKADIRQRGFSQVSMGKMESGVCGYPYTLSRHFTAADKSGRKVERLYCSSPIYGFEIKEKTVLAVGEPLVSTP